MTETRPTISNEAKAIELEVLRERDRAEGSGRWAPYVHTPEVRQNLDRIAEMLRKLGSHK